MKNFLSLIFYWIYLAMRLCRRRPVVKNSCSANRPISIYENSTLNNRPQYEALGNKPHKLCSYSPEPRAEVFSIRVNFNISKLVYFCCMILESLESTTGVSLTSLTEDTWLSHVGRTIWSELLCSPALARYRASYLDGSFSSNGLSRTFAWLFLACTWRHRYIKSKIKS